MQDFTGKTAVITGAGSGIGRGLALRLADEGVNIVVSDVEAEAAEAVATEVQQRGAKVFAQAIDVSQLALVQDLASRTYDTFGPVHLLFNNAGVSVRRRGIYATHADWEWVLGVNLWGVIHGIETFLPGMLESGNEAHIVNTASMNGFIPSGQSAMYSASKYGVIGITETLRNELAGTQVGVSALCPAGVTTRIHQSERNRPSKFEVDPETVPPHEPSSQFNLSPALDPMDVAELVLWGIRENLLYIHTDPLVKPLIEERYAAIISAFSHLDSNA